MAARTVTSREYKIMLRPGLFSGDDEQLIDAAGKFWVAFREGIADLSPRTEGKLAEIRKRRMITFYDTPEQDLYANGYVFRERNDVDGDKREVMLKFRHPDRYVAQDRKMGAADADKGDSKFEQDIKPPFDSVYSFSTKQKISADKAIDRMADPAKLYPDLSKRLQHFDADEALLPVAELTIFERVVSGGSFRFGESGHDSADCSLTLWYSSGGEQKKPLLAEFSFKHEDESEDYDGDAALLIYRVFEKLRSMSDWAHPEPQTKTAYVYARAAAKDG